MSTISWWPIRECLAQISELTAESLAEIGVSAAERASLVELARSVDRRLEERPRVRLGIAAGAASPPAEVDLRLPAELAAKVPALVEQLLSTFSAEEMRFRSGCKAEELRSAARAIANVPAGDLIADASRPAIGWQFEAVLSHLRRRPAKYGVDGSFEQLVAFLAGYDEGRNGALATGFARYLSETHNADPSVPWTRQVIPLCDGDPLALLTLLDSYVAAGIDRAPEPGRGSG
ncbi:hypothetical protein [Actinokineospora globicatena]|uniref:Uncharacterized protein n=1 Tax=Actinokineospora globicatena TaxID=103729 RepID=A0A9W6QHN0_9PSEU|nr:hypothetical protein [Actinokineospora globicatena]GLW89910.1 hypothetical protein Aglo03_07260 [Actinokineospora globicatena]